jgi:Anthrone oxygenase
MAVHILALLVLGLMCGSELNVAALGHPNLNRQPLEVHIPMRSSLAALLGKVMPFWFAASTLLNLLLLMPFERLSGAAWRSAAVAFAIQVVAVLFSLVAPVPINNRIAKWTVNSLPENWKAMEHRWDIYHGVRTAALIIAFVLLALSLRVH